MSDISELLDMKNWETKEEYGPYGFCGIGYSWIGHSDPVSIAERIAEEVEELQKEITRLKEIEWKYLGLLK
jgi:hypothetical protein